MQTLGNAKTQQVNKTRGWAHDEEKCNFSVWRRRRFVKIFQKYYLYDTDVFR